MIDSYTVLITVSRMALGWSYHFDLKKGMGILFFHHCLVKVGYPSIYTQSLFLAGK